MTEVKHLISRTIRDHLKPDHKRPKSATHKRRYAEGGNVNDDNQMSDADLAAMSPETFANPFVKGAIDSAARLVTTPGSAMRPNPYPAGSEEASWFEDQRAKTISSWAPEMAATMTGGAGVVPAEANTLRMGIKAYHGSPHDFDAFDLSKVGSGEGAQSYGHGLYFAENPKIAEEYADKLGKPNVTNDDLVSGNYNLGPAGHRYEVNINADPAHFLDYDKPLNQQLPEVQDALKKAMGSGWDDYKYADASSAVRKGLIAFRDETVAKKLNEAGIPGIKYLDQGSRAAGDGSRNYVVFNDKLVDILKKYGIAGAVAPTAAAEIMGHQEQHMASGGRVHMAAGGSPGMFDDLVPAAPAATAAPAAPDHGMFSDLVPGNKLDRPDEKPLIGDGGQFSSGTDWGNNFADAASKTAFNAMKNAPASAVNFAREVVQPIIHPVDTATNLKNLGLGVLEKAGVTAGDSHEKYANAVGHFFADRYGGFENARHTLETDPVGMAGDLSAVLSGGETVLGRLPGVVGKAGEVAGDVGRATDPLRAAAPVAETAGNVVGNTAAQVLGVTTGVGADPLKVAAGAGYQGGAPAQAFRENITGAAPLSDAVDEARGAVSELRKERGDAYRSQMGPIKADSTILDFNDIDTAVANAQGIKTYSGRSGTGPTQSLSPKTEAIRKEMTDAVDNWKGLDPAEFHTPEGIDALKQQLGDIRDGTEANTPSRVAADRIYNAVRQTIIDKVPEYAKVMQGYEQASKQIKEIETTLSLKPNANVDTALRKLQSTLRDNVNTSFGRRAELANFLVNAGAPNLMEKLAGQALHSWVPRGLARLATMETIPAAAGALGAGMTGAGAAAAATLPLMSPRLVGNAAYGAGVASRFARPVIAGGVRPARQIGRVTEPFWKPGNPYAQQ